jgi:hypothetical protein
VFHVPKGRLRGRKAWPDYQQCLTGAPPNQNKTGPDRSVADFTWCLLALSWDHEVGEVTARLRQVSEKAAQQGERYAITTTQQAAKACPSNGRADDCIRARRRQTVGFRRDEPGEHAMSRELVVELAFASYEQAAAARIASCSPRAPGWSSRQCNSAKLLRRPMQCQGPPTLHPDDTRCGPSRRGASLHRRLRLRGYGATAAGPRCV